jgi:hypothetical protein
MADDSSAVLVAGTAEGQLIGWRLAPRGAAALGAGAGAGAAGVGAAAAAPPPPELLFAFTAAPDAVRALAASDSTLVVGVGDSVLVFDVASRRQRGTLAHHTDTVVAAAFAGGGAVLTADRAGVLCVWDSDKWAPTLSVRAHK